MRGDSLHLHLLHHLLNSFPAPPCLPGVFPVPSSECFSPPPPPPGFFSSSFSSLLYVFVLLGIRSASLHPYSCAYRFFNTDSLHHHIANVFIYLKGEWSNVWFNEVARLVWLSGSLNFANIWSHTVNREAKWGSWWIDKWCNLVFYFKMNAYKGALSIWKVNLLQLKVHFGILMKWCES